MSAAIARRRKQLAAKKAAAAASGDGNGDPITQKLNSLLSSEEDSESTAYEALQLAQSQVRKAVIAGDYEKATVTYAYDVLLIFLRKNRASVASQHLTLLVQVLNETHTACDAKWIERIQTLSDLNVKAIQTLNNDNDNDAAANLIEYKRLMKLHAKFLKSALGWSEALGSVRYGATEIHNLLADQLWLMSTWESTDAESSSSQSSSTEDDSEDADDDDYSKIALQSEAITHYALAENPTSILTHLKTLPPPTLDETAQHHTCPPSTRESLLTRSILLLLSISNIRDAHTILTTYLQTIETRNLQSLKISYMSKTDGKAPPHPIFLSMLLEISRKNSKTGPLFTWALKSFNNELMTMYKPDVLKMYTNRIGKVYFQIMPPPSMMSTIENMMSMMGGGAGGAGGAGGMPGGINPAMMQAMMGGGGF